MKPVSLYLGCLIPNRFPGIEVATKFTLTLLSVPWSELKGASCCPAPGVFQSFDKHTWLVIAARNIALAEEQNTDILTLCNGCYGSLLNANNLLRENRDLRYEVNIQLKKIGRKYQGNIEIRHITEYLHREVGIPVIQQHLQRKLPLRIAVHYGCHLLKPSRERRLGSFEQPRFFDELVEAVGAESADYTDKMMCCGAGGGVRSGHGELALQMSEHKIRSAQQAKIDCIVNACPFCHLQLSTSQRELKLEHTTPVLHYMQLLAFALGMRPEDMALSRNAVVTEEFLGRLEEQD
jgi:heterodisulfide reductase subunit B